MTTIETIAHQQSGRSGAGALRRGAIAVVSVMKTVASVMERRRSRLALLELSDQQLKDIGVTRADAHREGVRRIWD